VPQETPALRQQVLRPEVLAAQLEEERLEHPQRPVLQVSATRLLRPCP
jgi:hypothetical protein